MTALSWVGLAGDTNLSSAANLSPAQVPIAGDSIDFPAAAVGICTWDMNLAFLVVTFDPASNIAVTQTVKATFTGTFAPNGTGGSTWAQNGYEIEAAAYQDIGQAVVANPLNFYRATGSSSANLSSSGNDMTNVYIAKPSGALQLLTGYDIIGTLTLDCTGGNQTVGNPVVTMNINKVVCIGTGAFVTTWGDAFNALNITVTETDGVLQFVDTNNVIVTGGPLYANSDNSSDLGGSSGINFVAPIVWDDGDAGSLASAGDNWVGDVAPGINDIAQWDATALGNCTMDIASIGAALIAAAYTGTITQSVDFVCSGNFDQDAGTWIASGFKFQVDGIRSGITPAVFIQDNSAGSKMYIGLGINYPSAQAGNSWDSNDIILGYGQGGIIFQMRNDDFRTRMNVTFVVGNTYEMIGRVYCDLVKSAGGTYIITDNGSQQLWTDCNYDQMDEIDYQPTAINRINLVLDGVQFDGIVELNGCFISAGAGYDIPIGAEYRNAGIFEHWSAAGAIGTIQGYLSCETYNQGSPASITRGGDMTVTGTLIVNGVTTVCEDDTVKVNRLDISAALVFNTGGFIVETAAEFDAATYAGDILASGNVTLSAGATVSMSLATLSLNGINQTIDLGGHAPKNIKYTGSGLTTLLTAIILTGKHIFKPSAPLAIELANGGAFGALELDAAGVNSFATLSLDAIDSLTAYTMPVTQAGVAMKYCSIGRMTLTGVAQPIDSNTSTDLGGNRLVPPEVDGLEFLAIAPVRETVRPIVRSVIREVVRPI